MDFIDQGVAKVHVLRGILREIVRVLSPVGEVMPERAVASRLLARGAAEACAKLAARFFYVGGMTDVASLANLIVAEWQSIEQAYQALGEEERYHARTLSVTMVSGASGAGSIATAMDTVDKLVRFHQYGKGGSFDDR